MWEKGVRNNVYFFQMYLNLNDCQFKTSGYSYRSGSYPGERNGNHSPLQYSCLGNPMNIGAWWATVHGVSKSQIQLNNWAYKETVEFSSVAQSCLTLCDPTNRSTPGLPVHHHLPEFTQAHIHQVGDAIQPSHPLSSPSPPAPNPSQHQSLFQWVNYLHEVAKVWKAPIYQISFLECSTLMY